MDPTVARRNVTVEVQDQREQLSALCAFTALDKYTQAVAPTLRRRPRTQARTPTKPFGSRSTRTHIHTSLRPRRPAAGSRWSPSLDDVVKKLHGLHDVFILEEDIGFRSGGASALSRQLKLMSNTPSTGTLKCVSLFSFNELFIHTGPNKPKLQTHLLFHLHLCLTNEDIIRLYYFWTVSSDDVRA